jgi:DNA-directed RNA polymerase specialized sigma24 family protein
LSRREAKNRKWDGLTADQRHLILREAYRNYLTFEQFVTDTGKDVIEYSVPVSKESDDWIPITISFTDLQRVLNNLNDEGTVLSKRKEQAFYLNVIRDMKQKDVAEIMNITTVSVGQYVEQAMLQLAEHYFGETREHPNDDIDLKREQIKKTREVFGTLTNHDDQESE